MTSSEIYHIYTEIDQIQKEHHLKDALPRLAGLKTFVGRLYHETREEEIAQSEELELPSEEDQPTPSDEEFVAAEDSIDYEDGDSSDSDSDSCDSACTCEACKMI